MATGYTCEIKDGIDFKTFLKRCARAFGAYVEFRDEDMDKDVDNEFKMPTYYLERLQELETELVKVKNMTDDEILKEIQKLYKKSLECQEKYIIDNMNLKEKYEDMLSKVNNWNPPTPDHINLKDFMIQQITDSIKWDCGDYTPSLYPLQTASEWRASQIESIEQSIIRYREHHLEDLDRYNERVNWVKALNESIKEL